MIHGINNRNHRQCMLINVFHKSIGDFIALLSLQAYTVTVVLVGNIFFSGAYIINEWICYAKYMKVRAFV